MKEKIKYWVKIGIMMAILFAMAAYNQFPIYWRFASAIWFLVFVISILDELYQKLKKN